MGVRGFVSLCVKSLGCWGCLPEEIEEFAKPTGSIELQLGSFLLLSSFLPVLFSSLLLFAILVISILHF